MATFQIGGLTSGLDTNSIVSQLMQVERQPLFQIQNKQKILELKKELFSEINSNLSSLHSSVKTLLKAETFNQLKSITSDEDVVTASLSDDAVSGTYSFSITKLATSTTVTSSGTLETASAASAARITSDSEVVVGTGYLDTKKTFYDAFNDAGLDASSLQDGTITVNGVSFEIDIDTTTIDQFINDVNSDPDAGVTISYDTSDPNNDLFIITSDDTGSDAYLTLSDETGFLNLANITTLEATGSGTADPDAALDDAGITDLSTTGSVYFKIDGYAFNFDTSVYSLNKIIEIINQSDAGVTMFYDPETDKVNLSRKDTGSGLITLEDIDGNFLEALHLTTATQNEGNDAEFTLNGQQMIRSSNQFEVNGINFDLKKANSSATITVERDIDTIYNSIKDFVDKYNSTINLLNTRLSEEKVEDPTTELAMRKGLLRGDSTLFGLRSSLRQIVTSNVTGLNNKYTAFMELGISTSSVNFGKDGTLEIDEEKLKEALQNDPVSVKNLFFNDIDEDDSVDDGEKGIIAELYNKLEQYISTSTFSIGGRSFKKGIIPMRMSSMTDLINDYNDKIADMEKNLEMVEERYWEQFTTMEKALSKLQNQQNWLMNQLTTLGGY